MSPEAQRIAIAEACGWKHTKEGAKSAWFNPAVRGRGRSMFRNRIPDYLGDLNAMQEACGTLDPNQQCHFIDALDAIIRLPENIRFGEKPAKKFRLNHFGRFHVANATAAQRAEAFLRSLNLWKSHP